MKLHIREAATGDAESVCRLLVEGGALHAQALPGLLHPPDPATTLGFVKRTLQDEHAHILLDEAP